MYSRVFWGYKHENEPLFCTFAFGICRFINSEQNMLILGGEFIIYSCIHKLPKFFWTSCTTSYWKSVFCRSKISAEYKNCYKWLTCCACPIVFIPRLWANRIGTDFTHTQVFVSICSFPLTPNHALIYGNLVNKLSSCLATLIACLVGYCGRQPIWLLTNSWINFSRVNFQQSPNSLAPE
jgi:hypothetical protein